MTDLRREGEGPGSSDEDLVERARAGDGEALRLLLNRHEPSLRDRVRRELPASLRRKVGASDVIQEAYLGVHRNLANFEPRGEGSFERWLARIVDNKVRDTLRHYLARGKRGRQREVSRPHRADTRQFPARQPTPSAIAMAAELEARVRESFERLSPDHQDALRLLRDEGLSMEQAGERLGRSGEAMRKLYARAVTRLRELTREMEVPGHGGPEPD
jgi:RNA polymerase sigma-70 factor (ECF subfamily)